MGRAIATAIAHPSGRFVPRSALRLPLPTGRQAAPSHLSGRVVPPSLPRRVVPRPCLRAPASPPLASLGVPLLLSGVGRCRGFCRWRVAVPCRFAVPPSGGGGALCWWGRLRLPTCAPRPPMGAPPPLSGFLGELPPQEHHTPRPRLKARERTHRIHCERLSVVDRRGANPALL